MKNKRITAKTLRGLYNDAQIDLQEAVNTAHDAAIREAGIRARISLLDQLLRIAETPHQKAGQRASTLPATGDFIEW